MFRVVGDVRGKAAVASCSANDTAWTAALLPTGMETIELSVLAIMTPGSHSLANAKKYG